MSGEGGSGGVLGGDGRDGGDGDGRVFSADGMEEKNSMFGKKGVFGLGRWVRWLRCEAGVSKVDAQQSESVG